MRRKLQKMWELLIGFWGCSYEINLMCYSKKLIQKSHFQAYYLSLIAKSWYTLKIGSEFSSPLINQCEVNIIVMYCGLFVFLSKTSIYELLWLPLLRHLDLSVFMPFGRDAVHPPFWLVKGRVRIGNPFWSVKDQVHLGKAIFPFCFWRCFRPFFALVALTIVP